jgi:hypothetical protein
VIGYGSKGGSVVSCKSDSNTTFSAFVLPHFVNHKLIRKL